jgi:Peptidase family M1 domain
MKERPFMGSERQYGCSIVWANWQAVPASPIARYLCTALVGLVCVVLLSAAPWAEGPPTFPDQAAVSGAAQAPNSDKDYLQLRNVATSGEVFEVSNLVLKRDAGIFTFKSGRFFFLAQVEGKITGGVFIGEGSFSLVPPIESERRNLMLFSKAQRIDEEFSQAVFRFTDGTRDEIAKQGTLPSTPAASPASELLAEVKRALINDLQYNLDLRILQDVASAEPGGLFAAFIEGKKYNRRELYVIDPHGVQDYSPRDIRIPFHSQYSYSGMGVAPEEVAFLVYDPANYAIWTAFHYSDEYATGKANGAEQNGTIDAEHYKIEVAIDNAGHIKGTSTLTFTARVNSVRVVILSLYETLRVKSVDALDGSALPFIQEETFKKEDAKTELQVGVILPKALATGERYTMTIAYGGPDVVQNVGNGNYYPVSRDSWYPTAGFGEYATYDLRLSTPKGLTMVATGTPLRQIQEGSETISDWHTDVPLAVAGFNFGKFKKQDVQLADLGFTAEVFANTDDPGIADARRVQVEQWRRAGYRVFAGDIGGTFDTTAMMKKALGEAQLAVPLYTDYFGRTPFHRLAITQQTALGFGQSWPELIFLPLTSFLDSTARYTLGMDDPHGFFKEVGPHEIAHQWWGHAVGFRSYRDQWLSEGFSDFSASLFLQAYYKEGDDFHKFWDYERYLLTHKNEKGYRAIDAGPVTLGYRLMNQRTGVNIPRVLIYPKGAYVLHMLRMMMWDMQKGDEQFKAMMHDFVNSYTSKLASTEDFKAVVERHMTPVMNAAGNNRMDWFFSQWVYGTGFPKYDFKPSFSKSADGTISLNVVLSQSGVDDSFMMPVPIYLELADGRMIRIGSVLMKGSSTLNKQIALHGLKDAPKRALINYNYDVLSE